MSPGDWGLPNVRVYSNLRGSSLADLYRASNVFVLPSTGEGFPLVIQEALACGLPVVCGEETATADDALAAFVRGVAVVPDRTRSAEGFLSAIRDVLKQPASDELAARRFAFVQERYSWDGIVKRYFEIFSELLLSPREAIRGQESLNPLSSGVEAGSRSDEMSLYPVASGASLEKRQQKY
jgi:glycosyltransferase involved in cell wall biosynthesis